MALSVAVAKLERQISQRVYDERMKELQLRKAKESEFFKRHPRRHTAERATYFGLNFGRYFQTSIAYNLVSLETDLMDEAAFCTSKRRGGQRHG